MSACKTLFRTSLSSVTSTLRTNRPTVSLLHSPSLRFSPLPPNQGLRLAPYNVPSRPYASISSEATAADFTDEAHSADSTLEPPENPTQDTVEELLRKKNDVARLRKMERRHESAHQIGGRWFPYLDKFSCGEGAFLNSGEVLEAVDPYIMDVRKEKFRKVVKNRSYGVCLVVEGLGDFGNVSAAFRSADALGFQSVHVVSCDSKRYRDNRHVSMGAEKWLDIEIWNSTAECFEVLKSRGYRIATTHLGMDSVSIYDMDWSCPTAIVVGNENRGISDEALALSDLHCSIPMKGMVDSFNVSVAAGLLMHHAVCDRTSRLGSHGDLTFEESQILLAEFSLRHSKSSISIAREYVKRKASLLTSKI
ncbi:tRNA (guanosine(18)-2'-O)-methyltransferase isoform X1 [Pyrus x bretschneideri]|uniref:tRNA (guanosine(18)-2'-O)-methyltransferase isoform X1 n=1 Tax=Pyrus x bretschneideri TaxID=225117 RepID=UPI00202E5FA0|nr:tRNA (guanosine(18)-2'-O)-methyltransferase isoform X1 [Pyrus x bretschneideri]